MLDPEYVKVTVIVEAVGETTTFEIAKAPKCEMFEKYEPAHYIPGSQQIAPRPRLESLSFTMSPLQDEKTGVLYTVKKAANNG